MPVAKHGVQFLQVIQRRAGGGLHIAPVITKGVLLEFKVLAGGRHELPHTRGLSARDGLGIKGALNERQQGQLGGHIAQFQLFNDVEQVFLGALGHAVDVVWAAGVPLLAVTDEVTLQVWHRKAPAYPVPQIDWCGQRGHCT